MVMHSGPEKEYLWVDVVHHVMSVFQDYLQSSKEEKALLSSPIPLSLGLLRDSYEQNNGIQNKSLFPIDLLLIHFYQLCLDVRKQKQKKHTFFSF